MGSLWKAAGRVADADLRLSAQLQEFHGVSLQTQKLVLDIPVAKAT